MRKEKRVSIILITTMRVDEMEELICDYCKKPIEKFGKDYIIAFTKLYGLYEPITKWHFHTDCFYKMLEKGR